MFREVIDRVAKLAQRWSHWLCPRLGKSSAYYLHWKVRPLKSAKLICFHYIKWKVLWKETSDCADLKTLKQKCPLYICTAPTCHCLCICLNPNKRLSGFSLDAHGSHRIGQKNCSVRFPASFFQIMNRTILRWRPLWIFMFLPQPNKRFNLNHHFNLFFLKDDIYWKHVLLCQQNFP